MIWVRSRNCGCLVTWFCYQLIAKPGNKTATVPWPDPYKPDKTNTNTVKFHGIYSMFCQLTHDVEKQHMTFCLLCVNIVICPADRDLEINRFIIYAEWVIQPGMRHTNVTMVTVIGTGVATNQLEVSHAAREHISINTLISKQHFVRGQSKTYFKISLLNWDSSFTDFFSTGSLEISLLHTLTCYAHMLTRRHVLSRAVKQSTFKLWTLTHLPLVPHICVSELDQHSFRQWLVACSASTHYLNQYWLIVDQTLRNKFQWNSNQNTKHCIH